MNVLAAKLLSLLIIIVGELGYMGVFVSTALEYACFPISSEILLPFLGYTAAKGELDLVTTVLFATMGGVAGSLICYFIGRFGRNFFRRFMKYKGLRAGMTSAKKAFDKYGKASVFIARIFPIARTYVSIPAGMSAMPVGQFSLYTAGGALIWNTVLIGIGYALGENYIRAENVFPGKKRIILLLSAVIILAFVFMKRRKKPALFHNS